MLAAMQTELIQSPLLASNSFLSHGFLSNHTPAARDELDRAEPSIATVKQVHKNDVVWASTPEKRMRDADGIGTFTPGLAVGVYSADCSPVLLAALDSKGRPMAVMAVHAGWRGTALKISEKALAEFSAVAAPKGAASYLAAIGPCISMESFEVGEEVVQAFPGSLKNGRAKFLREESGHKKYLFDLPGENVRQLKEYAARSGIALKINDLALCTLKLHKQFPSYRRDREKAGRILSYLSFQR